MSQPTNPYEMKLATAQTLLDAYNARAAKHNQECDPNDPDDEPMPVIDVKKFFRALTRRGAIDLPSLALLSWEAISECGVTPEITAQSIAAIFRAPVAVAAGDGGGSSDKMELTPKRVARMGTEDLLRHYKPTDPVGSLVSARLGELSKGRPFLVFKKEGEVFSVDVDASLTLLEEIKEGEAPREFYAVEGAAPRMVYAVGANPAGEQMVDECPIHVGERLRKDGTCPQTNKSWTPVPRVVWELVRIALGTAEIRVVSLDTAHDLMDRIKNYTEAEREIRSRYPRASVEHDRLKGRNQLPPLKLSKEVARSTRPFDGGR